MKKRTLVGAACGLTLAMGAIWVLSSGKGEKLDLPVAEVEFLDTFTEETTCFGRPRRDSEHYATVQKGGRLEVLNVAPGDEVKKGQILAIIDKTLNAAGLKSALSNFRLAQKEHSRLAQLARTGSASRDELDKALSNLEVRRALLERAKQEVEDSMVRAPSDGKVTVVVFRAGDKVPDGARIIAVEAPGALAMTCRIKSDLAQRLPTSTNVTWIDVEIPSATPRIIPTSIRLPKAGDFVGLDREVILSTEDPQADALEGRRVQAKIPLGTHSNVAKLPSDAIAERKEGAHVLVQQADGLLSWAPVQVVRRDASTAHVTGLPAGTTVLRIVTDVRRIDMQIGMQPSTKNDKG